MLNNFFSRKKLFCFTPTVMLVTFVIETILAIYVYMRYGKSRFGKVAALILLALATFQLAEHRVCADSYALLWSRVGFIAITLLPILGLYLVSLVSHKTHFLKLGYVLSAGLIIYLLFVPKVITGALCSGNYVIFNASQSLYWLYSLYYFGFVILGIWESLERIHQVRTGTVIKKTLFWIIVGYLSFMLPMGIVYAFIPSSRLAVASIMCGFALTLAFILAFKIVPYYNRIKQKRDESRTK